MNPNKDRNQEDHFNNYKQFGETFNQSDDPLKQFDEKFKSIEADPVEIYKNTKIEKMNITEKHKNRILRVLNSWKEHMSKFDRHVACPHPQHVCKYIDKEIAKDNSAKWINAQLNIIEKMFDYWSDHHHLPHGQGNAIGYNPIQEGRSIRKEKINAIESEEKFQYRMPVAELSHYIRQIKNIFRRAVLTTQIKFGLRGGQTSNILISDIYLVNQDINDLYPDLGTHPWIKNKNKNEDMIYLPSRDERPGVKSQRPTLMPIDRETKHILIKYLQRRPPVNEDYLFLNPSTSGQLNNSTLNNHVWKPVFHPEYNGSDKYKAITSHYARHRFTTYWRTEMGLGEEKIKYMRGAKDSSMSDSTDVMFDYVHTYYEDIRDEYLSSIYKFDI